MEPKAAPRMSEISFALRDLVRMVRECIIDAAAVYVKIFAEILQADRRAFDMPAGITHAPRTVPLKLLRIEFRFCEPKRKIGFVAFVFVRADAFTDTDFKVFGVMLVENIVLFNLRSVKIHISSALIRISLFKKDFDHVDEIRDAACCRNNRIRFAYIELHAVVKALGNYEVPVKLHPKVTANLTVSVVEG